MEVELNRCSLTNQSIGHDDTYRQAGGRSNHVTLLVEELAEIYTTPTPTPKGWHGARPFSINVEECSEQSFTFDC